MSKYLEKKLGKDITNYIYQIIHKRNMKNVNEMYLSKFKFRDDYNMLTFYDDYDVECYCVHHRRYINTGGNSWDWNSIRTTFIYNKEVNIFTDNKWLRRYQKQNNNNLPNNY